MVSETLTVMLSRDMSIKFVKAQSLLIVIVNVVSAVLVAVGPVAGSGMVALILNV